MITWMQEALSKLTIDEFERAIRKVTSLYHEPVKIIGVKRSDEGAKVVIQIASGARKLVVL
jgi:hypothetical protein